MLATRTFPPPERSGIERIAKLDALRVVLILLGVVLHAADVYRPSGWLVADRIGSPIFQVVADFIHIFRMPMLFFVSGLLLRLTASPNEFTGNVVKRGLRLVLPFAVIALTLNASIRSLQSVCSSSANCVSWKSIEVDHIQHLWFLSDLFLFTLMALGFLRFRHWLPRLNSSQAFRDRPELQFCAFSAVTVLAGALVALTPYRYYAIGFGSSLIAFATYGGFFFSGCWLGKPERLSVLDRQRWKPIYWVFLGLLVGVCLYARTEKGALRTMQMLILEPVAAWAMVWAMWHLAAQVPSQLLKRVGSLAPLCFTIYLVHTFFVVLLGWALTTSNLPVGFKFVLLTGLSAALSIYTALLVQGNAWLKLLVNGVLPERPLRAPALDRRQKQP